MENSSQKVFKIDENKMQMHLRAFEDIKRYLLTSYKPLLDACNIQLNRESLNWLSYKSSNTNDLIRQKIKQNFTESNNGNEMIADMMVKDILSKIRSLESYLFNVEPYKIFKVGMLPDGISFNSNWISFDSNGEIFLSESSKKEMEELSSLVISSNDYAYIIHTLGYFTNWFNDCFLQFANNYGVESSIMVLGQIFEQDADNQITLSDKGIQWLLDMRKWNNPNFKPNLGVIGLEKALDRFSIATNNLKGLNAILQKANDSIESK